ncbi:HEAT repeat protein [Rubripirellula tenax]|uniref:HEAT repeat protein n=1 Tax=Rubripirellula tenax TaxID=2528015 RepID=A0A5C6F5A8_9BACT|nr:HEAT repeat domain-containing protein [Rubripirellula tenax]TWU56405.1 HEAT repeat protein [Rubripirellula tenax]
MSKVVMPRPIYNRTKTDSLTRRFTLGALVMSTFAAVAGCQDGPLYALKVANPYYSMKEWKKDEAIGVTDHERRKVLTQLADTIATMPANRQQYWSGHLKQLIENEQSPEMRRLAVRAAGAIQDPSALAMVEKGLDDESVKVRMEACEALGRRKGDDAARMLAATIGTETNQDVRHTAMTALAGHKSPIAVDSLRTALSDRNPATRSLAIASLRGATGKNYGSDPEVWIAALDGKPAAQVETRIADRVRDLF